MSGRAFGIPGDRAVTGSGKRVGSGRAGYPVRGRYPMTMPGDVKLGQLTKYLFSAPSWPVSLRILIVLGVVIDGASSRIWEQLPFSGTIAFTYPAIAAFILTKPVIDFSGKTMTWNRSALLALSCTVFGVIITFASIAGGNPLPAALLRDLARVCLWPAPLCPCRDL